VAPATPAAAQRARAGITATSLLGAAATAGQLGQKRALGQ
jgi:hypothetical protein